MGDEFDARDWPHLSPEGQKAPTVRQAIEANSRLRLRLRKAEKNSQFQMVSRELSESPVWLALICHPKAMAAYWFLVGQLRQNAGCQDDGLVCPRRQFKLWCGGGGNDDAGEGLAIVEQLGLADVVFAGEEAANPRYSKPRRYALTTSSYQGNPRTNRWRSLECQSYASALLAGRQSAGASRASRMKAPPFRPRPPTPTQTIDSGPTQGTVKRGERPHPGDRHRAPPRGPPPCPTQGTVTVPTQGTVKIKRCTCDA